MAKGDTPPDAFASSHHKPLFPAPPTGTEDIKLFLRQDVAIQAQGIDSTIEDDLSTHVEQARITQEEPEWIPENADAPNEKGQWRRQIRFDLNMKFNCTPNINLSIIKSQVRMKLKTENSR
jgi:hypothetical protein